MKKNKILNLAISASLLMLLNTSMANAQIKEVQAAPNVKMFVDEQSKEYFQNRDQTQEKEFDSQEEAIAAGVVDVKKIDQDMKNLGDKNLTTQTETKSGPQDIGLSKMNTITIMGGSINYPQFHDSGNGISQINKDTLNRHTQEGKELTDKQLRKIYGNPIPY